MTKIWIYSIVLVGIIMMLGLTSAGDFGYNYLNNQETITTGANYSINVNNSNYLQGYTPTTLKDWIQGLFNSIFVPYTGANQNVNLGNNTLNSGNLNITNGITGGFSVNGTTGEWKIFGNSTSNIGHLYNVNNNGWLSIDMWMNGSDNTIKKQFTYGTFGKDKAASYRGNNYINSYDGKGIELQLLGFAGITLWNTSSVCINCKKDYIAQNGSYAQFIVIGNVSTTDSISSGGTINATGDICSLGLGICLSNVSGGGEPLWTANYTAFNSSWSSTTNLSYVPYVGANQNVNLGNNNFSVNGTTLFVNSANGRVGIGEPTPVGPLHVSIQPALINLMDAGKGTFNLDTEGWIITGANIMEIEGGALKITYVNHSNGAYVYFNATGDLNTDLVIGKTYRVWFRAKATGTVALYIVGPNVIVAYPTADYTWMSKIFVATATGGTFISFAGTFGAGEIMWIDEWYIEEIIGGVADILVTTANGRVGIGTTNPFQRLHVNGNILANGTINATTGFGVNGNSGINGFVWINTTCGTRITGGIITTTNCTLTA